MKMPTPYSLWLFLLLDLILALSACLVSSFLTAKVFLLARRLILPLFCSLCLSTTAQDGHGRHGHEWYGHE